MTVVAGLAIYADRLSVVVTDAGRRHEIHVLQWFTLPLEEHAAESNGSFSYLSAPLAAMRQRLTDHGVTLVAGYPDAKSMYRRLPMPVVSEGHFRDVLASALEEQLPFNLEDIMVAAEPPDRDAQTSTVLASAIQKNEFEDYLARFEEAGVDPIMVEPQAMAFALLLRRMTAGPENFLAFHCAGRECMMILHRNGELAGARNVTMDCQDHLVREIKRTLLSVELDPSCTAVYVSGLEPKRLRESLPCAAPLPAFGSVEISGEAAGEGDVDPVALGLAMHPDVEDFSHTNFRYGAYRYRNLLERARLPLLCCAALIAVIGMLLCVLLEVGIRRYDDAALSAKRMNMQYFKALFPEARLRPEHGVYAGLMQKKRKLENELGLIPDLEPKIPVFEVWHRLAAAFPGEKIRFRLFKLKIDQKGLNFEGSVASPEQIDMIYQSLRREPWFQDVTATEQVIVDDAVHMKYKIKYHSRVAKLKK